MNKRLYVGNLEYSVTDKDLEELFSSEGSVTYAKVIKQPDGRSKGFGFVEMGTEEEAAKAVEKFNHSSFKERTIVVNEARAQETRSFSGDRGAKSFRSKPKDDLDYNLKKLRRRL